MRYCSTVFFCVLLFTCVSLRADLIGYWPLDGSPLATVGMDGVEVNGPLFSVDDRDGNSNGAIEFDGIEQYIEIPGGGGLDGVSGGTISIWANWFGEDQDPDCCGGFGSILARQSNGQFSDNVILLTDPDPDFATVQWRQSGAGNRLLTSTAEAGLDVWNHIAVVFSPEGSELFLNGVSEAFVEQGPLPLNSDPSIPLSVGAWAGDGGGFGSVILDDLAIFDDLLSADQIMNLYDGSATPETVGPGEPFDPIIIVEPEPPVLPEGALPATILSVSSNLADHSGFNRTADYVLDLSGWTNEGFHSIGPEGNMWLNTGSFVEPNDLEPEIAFDLGAVVEIDSVKVWNYNETLPGRDELLGRGVAAADILVAGEDLEFTVLAEGVEFDIAPGVEDEDFGQIIDLGVEARYVKFDILSNHDGDNDFVGLSEVIFFGAGSETCVPGNGDLDGNGKVEFADFLTLSGNFGNAADSAGGDIDCDGQVAFADFLILSGNFGQDVGVASVPEPSCLGWVFCGMTACLLSRRRFRRASLIH